MADLAQQIPPGGRSRSRPAALGCGDFPATAFSIKAAVWPVNFWLVPGYSAAHCAGGGLVCLDDQSGRVHLAAAVDADVLQQRWSLGVIWWAMADGGGHGCSHAASGAIGMLAATRLTYLAGGMLPCTFLGHLAGRPPDLVNRRCWRACCITCPAPPWPWPFCFSGRCH